ncbi:MAG: Ni/Fe hydrogenase subunit alpha [Candidatus Korarchaeota archaeon]
MSIIKISPATRLEGEAEIKIFLDEKGKVKDTFFQVLEFRGFEKFCVGRPVEELPGIVTRICGVCPWAHHMASAKAVDMVFGREPTPAAKKIRELGYCAHILDSHSVHLYALALPDFALSPGAPRRERSLVGLYKSNPELVKKVLEMRDKIVRIEEIIGGKAIHPVTAIPGGVSKPLSKEEVEEIRNYAKELLKFSTETVELLNGILQRSEYKDIIFGDYYHLETYYAGLVDKNNKLNFYDGRIRVVDKKGNEAFVFEPKDYLDYIGEKVVEWSYTKMPYLKKIGWRGIDTSSGIYRVGPLGRLNASNGFATEKAQEYYKQFVETFGKPAHHTMAYHFARAIEMVYAAERMFELVEDSELLSRDVVNYDGKFSGFGVGVVEAPRGLLIHHYEADERGITTKVNLIIPTTMNNSSINLDIKKVASKLLTAGKFDDKVLNMIEMAFRAYDPCLACSTHSIPGGIRVYVSIYNSNGELIKTIGRS